jgi:hypothetical protein
MLPLECIAEAQRFLEGGTPLLEALKRTRDLLPESIWASYEAMDFEGLQEQVKLKQCITVVHSYYTGCRPVFFVASQVNKLIKDSAAAEKSTKTKEDNDQKITSKKSRSKKVTHQALLG